MDGAGNAHVEEDRDALNDADRVHGPQTDFGRNWSGCPGAVARVLGHGAARRRRRRNARDLPQGRRRRGGGDVLRGGDGGHRAGHADARDPGGVDHARGGVFASGTGTATLTFSYTVAVGDADGDGVSVPAGSIALEGGTLKDTADDDAAALGHDGTAADANRKVDGLAARVASLAFSGAAPRDADNDGTPETYRRNDRVSVAGDLHGGGGGDGQAVARAARGDDHARGGVCVRHGHGDFGVLVRGGGERSPTATGFRCRRARSR